MSYGVISSGYDDIIQVFFIIQRVKARAILCPHQPPTRVITVSVAQGGELPKLCYHPGRMGLFHLDMMI